jgi:Pyrimidine dimer DNA glycosylase
VRSALRLICPWWSVEGKRNSSVRIWDLPVTELCQAHLLGDHRELHGFRIVLTQGKRGYARHPETRRRRGKLHALYRRHEALVVELGRRGYRHDSALDATLGIGSSIQDEYVDTPDEQRAILRAKGCDYQIRMVMDRP